MSEYNEYAVGPIHVIGVLSVYYLHKWNIVAYPHALCKIDAETSSHLNFRPSVDSANGIYFFSKRSSGHIELYYTLHKLADIPKNNIGLFPLYFQDGSLLYDDIVTCTHMFYTLNN